MLAPLAWSIMLLVLLLMAAAQALALGCSSDMLSQSATVVAAHEPLFSSCESDLGLGNGAFIDARYLDHDQSERICASQDCVQALIVAMEKLPDCCVPDGFSSGWNNLPRLADRILDQCILRDEALLAEQLDAAVAELPDLQVQLTNARPAADASSEVDVVLTVKTRALVKAESASSSTANTSSQTATVATSSANGQLLRGCCSILLSLIVPIATRYLLM